MKQLIQIIEDAEKNKTALGHFNVSNLEMLKAVAQVARKLDVPVIIGASEGEREWIGPHHAYDLIQSYNKEHASGNHKIFLNADHTYSLEKVKEAAALGYDAIVFDGSKLSFEENIKQTREAVKIAKSINKNIIIEGELGYIGSGSTIRKEIPKGAAINPEDLTKPEEAVNFVKETGVDMLAPAVGNVHGMLARRSLGESGLAEGYDYPLDIERIRTIKTAVKIPLVLHGGSGNTDEDFRVAIEAGISIVHISTELRVAWRKGLEEALKENPEEVAPYKLMAEDLKEMEGVIEKKLRLFNKL